MIFYAAGNFVFMSNERKESEFRDLWINAFGEDYNRLVSFYFKKESDVIMSVTENEIRYFSHPESDSIFVMTNNEEIDKMLESGHVHEIDEPQYKEWVNEQNSMY